MSSEILGDMEGGEDVLYKLREKLIFRPSFEGTLSSFIAVGILNVPIIPSLISNSQLFFLA